jgi:hypothetical protein
MIVGCIAISVLAVVFLVLNAGCSMVTKQALKLQSKALIVVEESGATFYLTFLDEDTLTKRFGKPERNPFLSEYYVMNYQRVIPFEIRIINKSGVNIEISTRESFLVFESMHIPAYNQFLMDDYWTTRDLKSAAKDYDHNDKIEAIRQYVVDTFESILDGGSYKGILAFVGDTPTFGKAVVSIGIMERATGNLLKRIEFPYVFQ